jgi:hypothetical protein
VRKSFGCQYLFQTEVSNAATQTTGHYYYFSSEPEECFEVDTNEADETDPSWTPYTENIDIQSFSSPEMNRICGVMVSMLTSSAVDCGFEPQSGQTS